MTNDPNDGDSAPEVVIDEETLKIMKLNSNEEREMFRKVLAWCKDQNLRLPIRVRPEVFAALLTRFILAQGTMAPITDSPSNQSASKEPALGGPDEQSPYDDAIVKRVMPPRAKKAKDSVEEQNECEKAGASTGMRNQYLISLGTHLAALLAYHESQEDVAQANTPTVACIASAYYFKFRGSDDKRLSEISAELVNHFIDEQATLEHLRDCSGNLKQVLLSLSRASKASVQSFSDFEYLWSACAAHSCFRDAMTKLQDEYETDATMSKNDNGKRANDAVSIQERRIQTMKEICWKFSCLVKEQEQRELISGDNASGRRRRILSTAACLGILSSLPALSASESSDSSTKTRSESKDAQQDEGADKDDSSLTSHASKKSRTAEEKDVAETLRRMVQGRGFSMQEAGDDLQAPDIMDIITDSVNDLLETVHGYQNMGDKVTRPELEHSALHAIEMLISSDFLPKTAVSDAAMQMEMTAYWSNKNQSDLPPFVQKLKLLLPTKATRWCLVNVTALDRTITDYVFKAVDDLNKPKKGASFDLMSFVDEANLMSNEVNVLPYLCMASYKGGSDVVALIGRYDGDDIGLSYGSNAAATIASLKSSGGARAMRESMELNEWTASILSLSDIKPKTKLTLYLEASDEDAIKKKWRRPDGVMEQIVIGGGWRTVVIPLLNRVLVRLMDDASDRESQPRNRVRVTEKDGSILVLGDHNDAEVKLCKALIALYYQALEALLYQETARLKTASHPRLVMNGGFHRAALTFCCICLLKGLCSSSALAMSDKFLDLDLPCILEIMESCPYTYLKVSESLARALKTYKPTGPIQNSLNIVGLPRILQRHLSQCDVLVMDSLLWESQKSNNSSDSNIVDVINDMKSMPDNGNGPSWPPDVLQPLLPEEVADTDGRKTDDVSVPSTQSRPADHLYLSYVIRKLLKVVFFRISALCSELSIPPEFPVASQVWIAFRYLLRHHIELLYDRHIDQLLLCTMYGVCKMMKFEPEVSFSNIIHVYTLVRGSELGDRACERLVRHVKLLSDAEAAKSPNKRQYGNIIQFYNILFVPALKDHLLQSKSLKKAVARIQEFVRGSSKTDGAKRLSVEEREAMAARVDMLAKDSGIWANEPKSIPVKKGNVKMNVLLPMSLPTTIGPDKSKKKKRKQTRDKWYNSTEQSEDRVFFSIGGPSRGNLSVLNRIAQK